jgi:ubiquitin-like domain-containing CTD phosphatase 1
MGPLWAEILDHITPVLNGIEDIGVRVRPPAKLAVYSGYDSTIMQLLSTLNVWNGTEGFPPYASMVLIEIHEFVDDAYNKTLFPSKFVFRLIYNGKVLTSLMEGCADDSEVCDAQQLMARVTPFAIRAVDCVDPKAGVIEPMKVAKSLLSKTGGVLLALFVAFMGALLGALAVFFYLTGTVPNPSPHYLDKLKRKSAQLKNKLVKGRKKKEENAATPRGSMMTDNIEMTLSDADAFEDDIIIYEG